MEPVIIISKIGCIQTLCGYVIFDFYTGQLPNSWSKELRDLRQYLCTLGLQGTVLVTKDYYYKDYKILLNKYLYTISII